MIQVPTDPNSPLQAFLADPAAASALRAFEKQKWRMARDAAKELCKKDRARYLPLLIHANRQLATELIGKGLLNDAKPVIDHLRSYAPAEVMTGLDALFNSSLAKQAFATAASSRSAPDAETFLAGLREFVRIGDKIKKGEQPAPSEIRFVDDFALRVETIPDGGDDPSLLSAIAEIKALSSAIEAAGAWDWETLAEVLRRIPALSPLRHWKLYFRGYRLWFGREPLEARKLFERLPKGSASDLAARLLVDPEGAPVLPLRARAAWYLALAGSEKPDSDTLASAESEWNRGRWPQTIHTLRCAFGKNFFAPGDDFRSALADAVFNISSHSQNLSQLVDSAAGNYRKLMDIYENDEGFCARFCRMLCLSDPLNERLDNLLNEWKLAVQYAVEFYRGNSLMVSQAYLWLAEILAEREKRSLQNSAFDMILARIHGKRLSDGARFRGPWKDAIEKATEADPGNEDAWRARLHFLESTGQTPARNKLLDDLVERFPKNKEFVVKAGELALKRKALTKAEKYLAQARALDPLDSNLIKLETEVLFAKVAKAAAKGVPVDDLVQQIEKTADPTPGLIDFAKALWVIRLRIAMATGRNPEPLCAEAPSPPAFCVALAMLHFQSPNTGKSASRFPDISKWYPATARDLCPAAELLAGSWKNEDFKDAVKQGIHVFVRILENTLRPEEGSADVQAYLRICASFCSLLPGMSFSDKSQIIEPVFETLSRKFRKWPKSLTKNHPELEVLRFGYRWIEGDFTGPQRKKIRELKALADQTQNAVFQFLINHLFVLGQIDEPIDEDTEEEAMDFGEAGDIDFGSFNNPRTVSKKSPPASRRDPQNDTQLDLPF